MSIFPEGSFDGNYQSTFNPNTETPESAVVIVNAFGFREDKAGHKVPGPLNEELAHFTDEYFSHLPILVSQDVAPALETIPSLIMGVNSTSQVTGGLKDPKSAGTAGELLSAKEFMDREDYGLAIIVAQAFHVARVARMASKLNIVNAIPEGLPGNFDSENTQLWIHSIEDWKKRERLTIGYLTLRRMM
jgi:hypothetical protein